MIPPLPKKSGGGILIALLGSLGNSCTVALDGSPMKKTLLSAYLRVSSVGRVKDALQSSKIAKTSGSCSS